jgi:hypothetical protein
MESDTELGNSRLESISLKAIGRMAKYTGMERCTLIHQDLAITEANGKKARSMEMELWYTNLEILIKVNGQIIREMEKAV